MNLDTALAFALFAFVTSVTPGPNNLMLLASGVNFGLRRTLPHVAGISSGFCVMVAAVGLGLGAAFKALPWLYEALKWVGAAYMVWLAWCIATAGPIEAEARAEVAAEAQRSRPLGFWGAAAFQWVNPKAWVMAVGAFTTYAPQPESWTVVAFVAVLFALINAPSVAVWAAFGAAARRFLADRRKQIAFNLTMAALLLASLGPLLRDF